MLRDDYLEVKTTNNLVRLPLEGKIDLTYRCNNNCRHCWLSIRADSKEFRDELSYAEIKKTADEAQKMGCRRWLMSGGEPMLRQDFVEIFDYLTTNCNSYSINTNGTLITPKIAKILQRKGTKMVSLYGATAEVHDGITRNPGSFEATLRGFRYLKEAKACFTVQLIPMKDNYHQFKDMVELAESLSKNYRIGAAWLCLSASGGKERNAEIIRQRLTPKQVVELDKPDLSYEERIASEREYCCNDNTGFLFSSCINNRQDFHIDAYGKMTFCSFIKDPDLRYDLRKGNFKQCWEDFIPSLAKKITAPHKYRNNCGSCELRKDCRICPVYAYLEYGSFDKKVKYLCAVARESHKFKENFQRNHRRYFRIADITILVESDLPITDNTFHPKFKLFEVDGPGRDNIYIRHHFNLPNLEDRDFGKEIYRKIPWAIYKKDYSWVYLGILPKQNDKSLHRLAVFNQDHTRVRIYNIKDDLFLKGNASSLTLFPSDQLLLARILAARNGCYLHACGVNFEGRGLIFVGRSEAGKSTMATILKEKAEILCDERMIIRRKPEGFKIYGNWSHGEVPDVSASSAPLVSIMFLEKASENRLIHLEGKKEITRRILACLIRPFVTVDWWEKTLALVDEIAQEIPCYVLRFDKSGKVAILLEKKFNIGRSII